MGRQDLQDDHVSVEAHSKHNLSGPGQPLPLCRVAQEAMNGPGWCQPPGKYVCQEDSSCRQQVVRQILMIGSVKTSTAGNSAGASREMLVCGPSRSERALAYQAVTAGLR